MGSFNLKCKKKINAKEVISCGIRRRKSTGLRFHEIKKAGLKKPAFL